MRLTDTINKIKVLVHYLPDLPKDIFIITLILLTAIGSFMIGKLSFLEEKQKKELRITTTGAVGDTLQYPSQSDQSGVMPNVEAENDKPPLSSSEEIFSQSKSSGMYVGAKSGSTYYLPWCGGVKRIHEENKIWFKDKADAESKGYKPSSACKGI